MSNCSLLIVDDDNEIKMRTQKWKRNNTHLIVYRIRDNPFPNDGSSPTMAELNRYGDCAMAIDVPLDY